MYYQNFPCWAVRNNQWVLRFIPDHLKTQELCKRVVEKYPYRLGIVPDHLKIREMCEGAVEKYPYSLKYIPNRFKTQEICDKAVRDDPSSLRYLPDWFLAQKQQLKLWHDDYYFNGDKLIKWHDGYQKRKAQKASIKEEPLPIAWHPSRYLDWCMSEEEKKETEQL